MWSEAEYRCGGEAEYQNDTSSHTHTHTHTHTRTHARTHARTLIGLHKVHNRTQHTVHKTPRTHERSQTQADRQIDRQRWATVVDYHLEVFGVFQLREAEVVAADGDLVTGDPLPVQVGHQNHLHTNTWRCSASTETFISTTVVQTPHSD